MAKFRRKAFDPHRAGLVNQRPWAFEHAMTHDIAMYGLYPYQHRGEPDWELDDFEHPLPWELPTTFVAPYMPKRYDWLFRGLQVGLLRWATGVNMLVVRDMGENSFAAFKVPIWMSTAEEALSFVFPDWRMFLVPMSVAVNMGLNPYNIRFYCHAGCLRMSIEADGESNPVKLFIDPSCEKPVVVNRITGLYFSRDPKDHDYTTAGAVKAIEWFHRDRAVPYGLLHYCTPMFRSSVSSHIYVQWQRADIVHNYKHAVRGEDGVDYPDALDYKVTVRDDVNTGSAYIPNYTRLLAFEGWSREKELKVLQAQWEAWRENYERHVETGQYWQLSVLLPYDVHELIADAEAYLEGAQKCPRLYAFRMHRRYGFPALVHFPTVPALDSTNLASWWGIMG